MVKLTISMAIFSIYVKFPESMYIWMASLTNKHPWGSMGPAVRALADSAVAVRSALHQPRVPQVA